MYDSGITAASLVADILTEADISIEIPNNTWCRWINAVEQILYTDIIRETRKVTLASPVSPIALSSAITPAAGEGSVIFEDIAKVYADGHELIKASEISGYTIDKNMYWKSGGDLGYKVIGNTSGSSLVILYYVRPALKTVSGGAITGNILLPTEFVELVAADLRGEAYKLANEDSLSGKWINDYNSYVEAFKTWVSKHNSVYGES